MQEAGRPPGEAAALTQASREEEEEGWRGEDREERVRGEQGRLGWEEAAGGQRRSWGDWKRWGEDKKLPREEEKG